jgi:hypothetical protein
MSETFTAVVKDGTLQPTEPLGMPDGSKVELRVIRRLPDPEERANHVRRFNEALDALQAEAAKYPDEWWDEFDRELRENRVNFEERFDPLSP